MDRNSLTFVSIAELVIHRLSSDEFQVERRYAGATADLGPMSEAQLDGYLRNRSLVGIMPQQVIDRLQGTPDLSIQIVVSVLRPAVAAASS